MFFYNKYEQKKADSNNPVVKIVEPEPDTWVWMDGYKATDKDMKCMNDFQFELNKEYTIDGEVQICENGFHFCTKLENTFGFCNYRLINGTRYFKVIALVNVSELERRKQMYRDEYFNNRISSYDYYRHITTLEEKYVASKIILTEELGFEDLYPYIKKEFYFIKTEDEWTLLKELGHENYLRKYFMDNMKELNVFGDTFLCILFSKIDSFDVMETTINYIKALKEENISKDMLVYFTLEHLNKIN